VSRHPSSSSTRSSWLLNAGSVGLTGQPGASSNSLQGGREGLQGCVCGTQPRPPLTSGHPPVTVLFQTHASQNSTLHPVPAQLPALAPPPPSPPVSPVHPSPAAAASLPIFRTCLHSPLGPGKAEASVIEAEGSRGAEAAPVVPARVPSGRGTPAGLASARLLRGGLWLRRVPAAPAAADVAAASTAVVAAGKEAGGASDSATVEAVAAPVSWFLTSRLGLSLRWPSWRSCGGAVQAPPQLRVYKPQCSAKHCRASCRCEGPKSQCKLLEMALAWSELAS